jgi:hypothetical protein
MPRCARKTVLLTEMIHNMIGLQSTPREAAADIPMEVSERLNAVERLSDEDRKTIIEIARKSLVRFQPKTESEPKPEPEKKS